MFTAHTQQPDELRAETATTGGAPGARRAAALAGVVVVAMALALPAGALAETDFVDATNYSVGLNPYSVAVGDFNGDEHPDLAVANHSSDNVSVLLGRGDGSFGAATNFAAGDGPRSVAAGDFNGDQHPDLAVANNWSGNVSVLLGGGDGSFGAPTNYAAGEAPWSVAVGDFNGDQHLDLAVANSGNPWVRNGTPGNVSVLLGGGDGSFGAATDYAAGTGPSSVAVSDFNDDSDPDLAVTNQGGDVSVLLGTAAGSFGPATNYAVGHAHLRSVAVGDFNGDSDPDLAVAALFDGTVSVLLGGAGGSFGPPTDFFAGPGAVSVAVGDFNGDQDPDLAVANSRTNVFPDDSQDVSVLHGAGDGSFGPPTYFPVDDAPYSVAVGDFNGDRHPDLAVANSGSANVSVLLRNRDPSAADDAHATDEDTPLEVAAPGLLGNDSDPEDDALTAELVSTPAHGTLTLNADGSFGYTPNPDFNGRDSFSYRAHDAANADTATVTIDVEPVQDPPTAEADGYELVEDDSLELHAPGVLANDSDLEDDGLTAVLVSDPEHGVLTFRDDGSLTYTPRPDYSGSDSFTYRASDGGRNSAAATVTLDVKAVGDPPKGTPESYEGMEDALLYIPAAGVLENDTDADGDSLSAQVVSDPEHGNLMVNSDGSFEYMPERDYNGSDSFSYRVVDPNGYGSDPVTVTIRMAAEADAPRAEVDEYLTAEDTRLNVPAPGVLENDIDPDGDRLSAELVIGPDHGHLELKSDGSFSYTPRPGYYGRDRFTYRPTDGGVRDSHETPDPVTVVIEVWPVFDPPSAGTAPATRGGTNSPPPAPTHKTPAAPAAPPAASSEQGISQLRLGSPCVRPSRSGRVRIGMRLRMARPRPVQVRIDRAVGPRTGRGCPKQNRFKGRFRKIATMRRVATRPAAAGLRRLTLTRRLSPGLYRITVRAQLDNKRLSRPTRSYLRVLG